MPTEDIYNYRKVHDRLITSGQPTEDQLRAAAEEGFAVVINLATHNPLISLPDEASLTRSLEMDYYNIPVVWQNPTLADFQAFEALVSRLGDQKILLHCQANFRVTAFYGLYAQKHLGWSEADAEAFRAPIWQGSEYPIWEQFIQDVRGQINNSTKK